MPLSVRTRPDTGQLEIYGTVKPAGAKRGIRIRQRPGSTDPALAAEEARTLEYTLLRTAWHGEKPTARRFGEAVESYVKARHPKPHDLALIKRLFLHFGDCPLASLDQVAVDEARDKLLRSPTAASTIRSIIMPLSAILNHAARRGWCSPPRFESPRQSPGRTRFFMPAQVEALTQHAAPHLRPLITFLIGTGCRLGEALKLDWSDVDLRGARVILWEGETKSGRRRVVNLLPAAVAALSALPHREGRVFRPGNRHGQITADAYTLTAGGSFQIRTAWGSASRLAGLPGKTIERIKFQAELGPHTLRHSWATWHYAIHKDLLLLKQEGGWASTSQVERYAHLMPAGCEDDIRRVWGLVVGVRAVG